MKYKTQSLYGQFFCSLLGMDTEYFSLFSWKQNHHRVCLAVLVCLDSLTEILEKFAQTDIILLK